MKGYLSDGQKGNREKARPYEVNDELLPPKKHLSTAGRVKREWRSPLEKVENYTKKGVVVVIATVTWLGEEVKTLARAERECIITHEGRGAYIQEKGISQSRDGGRSGGAVLRWKYLNSRCWWPEKKD